MNIKVCAAIIIKDGLFLATQRGETKHNALKWEFPGGKIEPGETPEQCIKREIFEELGVVITVYEKLQAVLHNYPMYCIELIPFICHIQSGKIECKEHNNYQWLDINNLPLLDWAEADLKILKQLEKI